MANPHPQNLFKPHNQLAKRKRVPEDVKILRQASHDNLLRAIVAVEQLVTAKDDEFIEKKKNNLTMLEEIILNAYNERDYKFICECWNRLYGKAVEMTRFVDANGEDRSLIISDVFTPKE